MVKAIIFLFFPVLLYGMVTGCRVDSRIVLYIILLQSINRATGNHGHTTATVHGVYVRETVNRVVYEVSHLCQHGEHTYAMA